MGWQCCEKFIYQHLTSYLSQQHDVQMGHNQYDTWCRIGVSTVYSSFGEFITYQAGTVYNIPSWWVYSTSSEKNTSPNLVCSSLFCNCNRHRCRCRRLLPSQSPTSSVSSQTRWLVTVRLLAAAELPAVVDGEEEGEWALACWLELRLLLLLLLSSAWCFSYWLLPLLWAGGGGWINNDNGSRWGLVETMMAAPLSVGGGDGAAVCESIHT